MNQFPNALPRSCKSVMASAAAVALTLAFTVPGALHGDNGQGNAYGKNKDYPYGANQKSSRAYSIGLWGDLPYSAEQSAVIPNLLADMNSQNLAFTAHDGDLRRQWIAELRKWQHLHERGPLLRQPPCSRYFHAR